MTNIMCHPERNAVSKALRVILSEATLVAKSKDLGGPALPRRHALFACNDRCRGCALRNNPQGGAA